jgi:hypothetical protein
MQHLNFCREIKPYLGLKGVKLQAPRFLQKSDLYEKVTGELGQKIKNFDGVGLKITILYFLALSPTLVKKFFAMSAEVLTNFNRSQQHQ